MGVKRENQFPRNWKLDPQNEDEDDVLGRFSIHISKSAHLETLKSGKFLNCMWKTTRLYHLI